MGKLYYCEFCDKSFRDNIGNRKKHYKSVQHQEARRLFYAQSMDALSKLKHEINKPTCSFFLKTGFCKFGSSCRYSHLNLETYQRLKEEAWNSMMSCSQDDSNLNFDSEKQLQSWIEVEDKREEEQLEPKTANNESFIIGNESNQALTCFLNAFGDLNHSQIPVSLIPSTLKHLKQLENCLWG